MNPESIQSHNARYCSVFHFSKCTLPEIWSWRSNKNNEGSCFFLSQFPLGFPQVRILPDDLSVFGNDDADRWHIGTTSIHTWFENEKFGQTQLTAGFVVGRFCGVFFQKGFEKTPRASASKKVGSKRKKPGERCFSGDQRSLASHNMSESPPCPRVVQPGHWTVRASADDSRVPSPSPSPRRCVVIVIAIQTLSSAGVAPNITWISGTFPNRRLLNAKLKYFQFRDSPSCNTSLYNTSL